MHTLTDMQLRAKAPNGQTQRLFDGGGLYIEISPAGGKWWRLKYRHSGKEKRLSLGTYPAVALKHARERAAEARRLVANGVDPSAAGQAQKESHPSAEANGFEAVGREWDPGKPGMEMLVKKGNQLKRYKSSGQIGEGEGQKAGTAYQLKDGTMVYVPETPETSASPKAR